MFYYLFNILKIILKLQLISEATTGLACRPRIRNRRNDMKKNYQLAYLMLLAIALTGTAFSQEQVAWTVYVLEGDPDGALIPDVMVTGQDAQGNSFQEMTDSTGAVTVSGEPGTWQFAFAKDGYETRELSYDVSESGDGYVWLLPQGEAALTIYVHKGDLNGTMLSDVSVTGQDGQGKSFEGITDSDGTVMLRGKSGTWQFTFAKEGYETRELSYAVDGTMERAAYLSRSAE
jgi:hypothetical protein